MMKNHDLARPHGHAPSCSCRACLNLAWMTANGVDNKPVPLDIVHAADCGCPACRHPAERRRSLYARFQAASAPGDLAAIALGLQLGLLLCAAIVIAQNFGLIVSFVKGLW